MRMYHDQNSKEGKGSPLRSGSCFRRCRSCLAFYAIQTSLLVLVCSDLDWRRADRNRRFFFAYARPTTTEVRVQDERLGHEAG
jgi:hypothetical protein